MMVWRDQCLEFISSLLRLSARNKVSEPPQSKSNRVRVWNKSRVVDLIHSYVTVLYYLYIYYVSVCCFHVTIGRIVII